jgi:hypothetical protein
MNCARISLWYYSSVYTFIFLEVFKGPDNFIDNLSDNMHSCSWQGVATARLSSEWPGSVARTYIKTLTATVIVDVTD